MLPGAVEDPIVLRGDPPPFMRFCNIVSMRWFDCSSCDIRSTGCGSMMTEEIEAVSLVTRSRPLPSFAVEFWPLRSPPACSFSSGFSRSIFEASGVPYTLTFNGVSEASGVFRASKRTHSCSRSQLEVNPLNTFPEDDGKRCTCVTRRGSCQSRIFSVKMRGN